MCASMCDCSRDVNDYEQPLLLDLLLHAPLQVLVERAEPLQALSVVGHLVLVFTALLGECTSAVVDPLVAVDVPLPQTPAKKERRVQG